MGIKLKEVVVGGVYEDLRGNWRRIDRIEDCLDERGRPSQRVFYSTLKRVMPHYSCTAQGATLLKHFCRWGEERVPQELFNRVCGTKVFERPPRRLSLSSVMEEVCIKLHLGWRVTGVTRDQNEYQRRVTLRSKKGGWKRYHWKTFCGLVSRGILEEDFFLDHTARFTPRGREVGHALAAGQAVQ